MTFVDINWAKVFGDAYPHTSENLGGAVLPPLLSSPASFWLLQPGRQARGVRSCKLLPKILRGAGGRGVRHLDRKTGSDRLDRAKGPTFNITRGTDFM